jgi:hypothetical protein
MVHARLVLPYDIEVVNNKGETDRSAAISEYGRGTWDLRISMFLQVLEQALLAESSSQREAVMGLVDRAIERVVARVFVTRKKQWLLLGSDFVGCECILDAEDLFPNKSR